MGAKQVSLARWHVHPQGHQAVIWDMVGTVAQLCLTLCNPMGCSPPGFSVHRILQARILRGLPCHPPRGSSQPKNQTRVSCIAGRFFTI